MLNSKWSMGVLVKDDAELGKDRGQVIRLAVILYVLYTYMRRALHRSYGSVSRIVRKSYMEYSYFEKGCREKAKKCTRQSREVIWDMINEY